MTQVIFVKTLEAYNALGLAFQEQGRLVVRTLRKIFHVESSFHLNLLLLGYLLLLLMLGFELE